MHRRALAVGELLSYGGIINMEMFSGARTQLHSTIAMSQNL
jgi:hypothetical protein